MIFLLMSQQAAVCLRSTGALVTALNDIGKTNLGEELRGSHCSAGTTHKLCTSIEVEKKKYQKQHCLSIIATGTSPGAGLESAFDQADAAFADLIVTSIDSQGIGLDDEVGMPFLRGIQVPSTKVCTWCTTQTRTHATAALLYTD